MNHSEEWRQPGWVELSQVMLDSYQHWIGRDLITRTGSAEDDARALFEAPIVVVAHGTQPDPLLSYANRVALDLWEMDIETLLQTPSRLTAEPGHREERAAFMERTARDGHATGYTGIRVSRTGKRFRIRDAVIWNLVHDGHLVGQAASFANWVFLDPAD